MGYLGKAFLIFFSSLAFGQVFDLSSFDKNVILINKSVKKIDDQDLKFLDSEIENKGIQIFMIGETNHKAGLSYDIEAKIVKYLNEKHGFDLILMEDIDQYIASKFSLEYLNYTNYQVDSSKLLAHTLKYYNLNQFPLIKHIVNSKWSKNPIKLGGIALYPYGLKNFSEDSTKLKMVNCLQKYFINVESKLNWDKVLEVISSKNHKNFDTSTFNSVIRLLNQNIPVYDKSGIYYLQVLKNIKANFLTYDNPDKLLNENNLYTLIDKFGIRDRQMADNVFFYMNKYYPNRKIIILTTLYHSLKNISGYKEKIKEWKTAIPLGTILNSKGVSSYNLGIICFKGYHGSYSLTEYDLKPDEIRTFRPASKDSISHQTYTEFFNSTKLHYLKYDTIRFTKRDSRSLEKYISGKGSETAFLSFNKEKLGISNAKVKFIMHPLDDSLSISRDWTLSYDGIFFINEMKPIRSDRNLRYPIPKKYEYNEDDFPLKDRKPKTSTELFGGE